MNKGDKMTSSKIGNVRYFIYSDSHDVWIDTKELPSDQFQNFIGEFSTFNEAKKNAIDCLKTKISNYKYDLDECKANLKKLKG